MLFSLSVKLLCGIFCVFLCATGWFWYLMFHEFSFRAVFGLFILCIFLYVICLVLGYFKINNAIILSLSLLVPLLLTIAIFTLAERKWMASVQRRRGPNIVGFWGILQPFADGLKLISKEIIIPAKANRFIFMLSPCISLFFSFLAWIVLPFNGFCLVSNNCSILFILFTSSFGLYGILLAGWAGGSKYSFLGMLRAIAQMLSYEISISLCVLFVVLFTGSLNLDLIVFMQIKTVWFFLPLFPIVIIFLISILAETNRTPFDLAEAEAELVSGYNTEYSSMVFAFFFLGEYSSIICMSEWFVFCFLGGGGKAITGVHNICYTYMFDNISLAIKVVVIMFFFVFVRANIPRYRFKDLMVINWKDFLSVLLGFFFFYPSILWLFNALPITSIFNWSYFLS